MHHMRLLGSVLSSVILVGVLTSAAPAGQRQAIRAEGVRVLKGSSGSPLVVASIGGRTSRIVGFGFNARDRAWARLEDVDRDGRLDVVVTNISPNRQSPNLSPPPGGATSAPVPSVPDPAVFAIVTPPEGLPLVLDVAEPAAGKSTSKAGDRDNFGFGIGSGPPPCEFFDNREPEDLGVFDWEATSGDETAEWSHTFSVQGTPTKVKLRTWEIFSDNMSSTIDLDGHTLNFARPPFYQCDYPEGGTERVFVLSGSDASIAADGRIDVTFKENGDDIALDLSKVVVNFA